MPDRVTVLAAEGSRVRTTLIERVRVRPEVGLVRVSAPGARGPQGPKGDKGDPGDGVAAYVHHQQVPSATWTIVHNMGYRPNFVVEDSEGELALGGNPHYPDVNTLVITWGASFSGVAYLS